MQTSNRSSNPGCGEHVPLVRTRGDDRPVHARVACRVHVSLVAAGLILLTGAFLAPLFEDLPQATLGAIVVVAIAGFFGVDELRRFGHLRRSAIVLSLVALVAVLVFGVLPGLLIQPGSRSSS